MALSDARVALERHGELHPHLRLATSKLNPVDLSNRDACDHHLRAHREPAHVFKEGVGARKIIAVVDPLLHLRAHPHKGGDR